MVSEVVHKEAVHHQYMVEHVVEKGVMNNLIQTTHSTME
jgi:hypothetical protein